MGRLVRLVLCFLSFTALALPVDGQGAARAAEPEGLIAEARRYAESGQLDLAISTYERSLAMIDGPAPADADPRRITQWKAYDPIVRFNLATLNAAKGVDLFQAGTLDAAISSFRTSLKWNPYSRD